MGYDYDRSSRRYSYDRRASGSATPTFDKLFKDADKVETALSAAAKKTTGLADKVETAAKKSSYAPEVFELLGKMLDAARPAFDPFRPLLQKGDKELDEVKDAEFDAAKQARELYNAVRKDLDKAYNAVAQARQDKDGDAAKKVAHDLAMAVSTLRTIFGQFVRAYGH